MALAMGFSFFETVVVTSLGGFTGVIVFVFLSDTLVRNFKKRKEQKKDSKQPEVVKEKIYSQKQTNCYYKKTIWNC